VTEITGGTDLEGQTVLVTGGARGGRRLARALAARGASVVLAQRRPGPPETGVEPRALDPADPDALRAFAKALLAEPGELHALVLLGPEPDAAFALTGLLLERLLESAAPVRGRRARVVIAARLHPLGRSRPALLSFARGLHTRLKDAGLSPRLRCAAAAGLPAVARAVGDPDLRNGVLVGPAGWAGRLGSLASRSLPRARDDAEAWAECERRAGVSYDVLKERTVHLESRRRELLAGPRGISAMIRVKNEEEFLYPAVKSIAGCVDEILLIDNLSSDRTPEIIRTLAAEHPDKVVPLAYPHRVARWGVENRDAAAGAANAPHAVHVYYNWCLERCTRPFVLKWDGDMVALDRFGEWLERWRRSDRLVLAFCGANVHPDRRHLLAARCTDQAELEARLDGSGVPDWATWLTYDRAESRLFPHWGARFEGTWGWVEAQESPFIRGTQRVRNRLEPDEPCFLHMKFCKRDPWTGYTPELAKVISDNIDVGPPLTDDQRAALEHWGLDRPGDS